MWLSVNDWCIKRRVIVIVIIVIIVMYESLKIVFVRFRSSGTGRIGSRCS
jgi:hypothetical protein